MEKDGKFQNKEEIFQTIIFYSNFFKIHKEMTNRNTKRIFKKKN